MSCPSIPYGSIVVIIRSIFFLGPKLKQSMDATPFFNYP